MMKIFQRPHREVTLATLWLAVLGLVLFSPGRLEQLSPACLTEYGSLPVTPVMYVGTAALFAICLLSGLILLERVLLILEDGWRGAHE